MLRARAPSQPLCRVPAYARALWRADAAPARDLHPRGADAIRKKCQPREAKGLREFRRWARDRGELTEEESQAAFHFLEKFERSVSTELRALDSRLEQLRGCVGVQIFALSEGMLERAIALRTQAPDLKPFDEAILAAVLERADELRQAGATSLSFCTLDSDLRTASLAPLYQRAGLAVHNGFEF